MERFKKTIKKIAALAGGAVMVGAAMAGALAGLETLPQPFVSASGVIDSYIVVGTMGTDPAGLARDVAVGIDVGAAFAQKATTAVSGATAVTSVSEGVMVSAPGDDLNYGEDIEDIDAVYGDGDIDPVLKDRTYSESKGNTKNKEDYTQTLTFQDGTGLLVFEKNDEVSNEPVGKYLKFVDGEDIYNYKLNIPGDIEYNKKDATTIKDDFKGSKIEIQGKTYTFSNAEGDPITKLELLSGSVTASQGEYTTQTYTVDGKTYEVEVLIISDQAETAKFKVNGEVTDALEAGNTYELEDGLEIGVDEVLPNEGSEAAGADQVAFYLGAQKLTLGNNTAIEINDKEIDDWDTNVVFTGGSEKLSSISITAAPEDDIYLKSGEELVDPVFGQWKVVFSGVVEDTEEIVAKTSSDKGKLTFTNNAGKEVTVNVVYKDGKNVVYGDNYDFLGTKATVATADGIFTDDNDQAMLLLDTDTCTGKDTAKDCKGIDILVQSAGGEARVFDLVSIDTTEKIYSLKDMSTGKTYEKLKFGSEEDIGIIDDFRLDLAGKVITATNIDNFNSDKAGTADDDLPGFKTEKNALILLNVTDTNELTVEAFEGENGASLGTFTFDENDDKDDIEITVQGTTPIEKDSDTEVKLDAAKWGAIWTWDAEDKDDLTLTYPEEEAYAQVYIAPTGATTVTAKSGSVNVNYFNAATGLAKTDVNVGVPNKNVVLIGGPSVNKLVMDLATAGKTWTVEEWQSKTDKAIIQYIENAYGNYEALIIAGYAAKDTELAGKVVVSRLLQGQFSTYLKGNKVEIGTAGAATVNDVSFA